MIQFIFNVVLRKVLGGLMEKLVVRIIETILNRISPELRREINEFVLKLEVAAEATDNPWDDLAVMVLKIALGID